MQLVDLKGSRLSNSGLCKYVVNEGKITGYALHPSGDYLLVTSSRGKIYVFRLDTGELRGTIKIPINASDCLIDPSGLYVVVKVPPFCRVSTLNLGTSDQTLPYNLGNYG
jgi:WD40 repeat protein